MSTQQTYSIPLGRLCSTAGKIAAAISRDLVEWDYRLQKHRQDIKAIEAALSQDGGSHITSKVRELEGKLSGIAESLEALEAGNKIQRMFNGNAIKQLKTQKLRYSREIDKLNRNLESQQAYCKKLVSLRKLVARLAQHRDKAFTTAVEVSIAFVQLSALSKMGQKTIRVPKFSHGDLKSQIKALLYAARTVEPAQDRLASQISNKKLGRATFEKIEGGTYKASFKTDENDRGTITPMRRSA